MRRALARELLVEALGDHARLPSPDELQRLLTESEISLFTGGGEVDDRLLDAAWYLHAVAGSRPDLEIYSEERRRRAHQVSAHIFDVFLQSAAAEEPSIDLMRIAFASQVGYLGGELTPNAAAIQIRMPLVSTAVEDARSEVSLQAGILLLGLNRARLFPQLRQWRAELDRLAEEWGTAASSPYAAVDGVVRGCYDLLIFLVYGQRARLDSARSRFGLAMTAPSSRDDTDSRWVAAHLQALSDDLDASSVWSLVPPELPAAARAMALGDPPVLLLWPPQRRFLQLGGVSPLDRSVRRLALSFPTSAGKTLLAQLLIVSHIASGGRDVCVVAPTHSLGREIRSALDRRLSLLGGSAIDLGPVGLEDLVVPPSRAVVMTPEKLAALLHSDANGVLARFDLFVIDEAHLLSDGSRGWALEQTLSLLHHLTRETDHRLVVLSAALGNRVHVLQWLDAGNGVVDRHDDWRGPRRLHAVYTTEPQWENEVSEPGQGARLARRRLPLTGAIYLRGPEGNAFRGTFSSAVGTLVRRQRRDGGWARDGESTTMRAHLVPLIHHLAEMGQVLVVAATRSQASRLAQDIADSFDEHPPGFALAEIAGARVGAGHPLARVLRKGVAFHHGTLPSDLQAEIEEATRAGRIRVLVATTTLTEGVNLPFKTVLVADRGWGSGDTRVEVIDAGRLLNAIGRAGRAGRETEGWLILAEQQRFSTALFAPLDLTAEDIELVSTLAQPAALDALAEFEDLVAAGEDAVLSTTGPESDSLCAYVWFLAEALRELRGSVTRRDVMAALEDTLAWQQFDEELRSRWVDVATASINSYVGHSAAHRRRWARTGTSLPSASDLERVADDVFRVISETDGTLSDASPLSTLRLVLEDGRLAVLLGLPENRARGFKRRVTDSPASLLAVDELELLLHWVAGRDLESLADEHLAEVLDNDYRTEQLSEFVASVFEHHVPWTLGIVINWVNERLGVSEVSLASELPGYIHYGVPSASALQLMRGGVRSRRLAVRVADAFAQSGVDVGVTEWLATSGIPDWRELFDASPTELADLLSLLRSPSATLVGAVLAGEPAAFAFLMSGTPFAPGMATIAEARDEPEPRTLLVLEAGGSPIGRIAPQHHDQVVQLLGLGIELDIAVTAEGRLSVQLAEATDPE